MPCAHQQAEKTMEYFDKGAEGPKETAVSLSGILFKWGPEVPK